MSMPALIARKKALIFRLGISVNPKHAEIRAGIMATNDQNIASKTVPPALDVASTKIKANESNEN